MAIVLIIAIIATIALLAGYGIANFQAMRKGAPYVPSERTGVRRALEYINPKPGSTFIDLGCGDGWVVRYATRRFRVKGIGIDLNPLLIMAARVLSLNTRQARFMHNNALNTDVSRADYIFLYLMPPLLETLSPKLTAQCKPGTVIISNTFPIPKLQPFLEQTIGSHARPIFVYRL